MSEDDGGASGDEENIASASVGPGGLDEVHPVNIIQDEEANEIYLRMAAQSQARKGFIKKNWAEEETKLLKWAVIIYTRQKNITYSNLVSDITTELFIGDGGLAEHSEARPGQE